MTNKPILTQPASLEQYLDGEGWQLIPLHRYDTTDTFKGRLRQRGKSPVDGKWTTAIYKNPDQLAHMKKGFNVGVRLTASQLVVDVDPRNFGPTAETKDLPKEQWVMHTLDTKDNPFEQLCYDCGIDPDSYPVVETGSGGLHIYMTKPADISVKDSHPDYPGIEFKTIGRQVVSAGSVHPDTHALYAWSPFAADLADISPAPKFMLDIITRPKAAAQLSGGGGEYTAEQIEQMLNALNPEDFQDYTEWLTLMQACHYASHGEARIEFVEWSISDPLYQNDATVIGQKWDGFHTDKPGPKITTQTLHKIMHKAGKAEAIPRRTAADDFMGDDDGEVDAMILDMNVERGVIDESERGTAVREDLLNPLEILNRDYWAANDGGKFKIYHRAKDMSFDPPRQYWSTSTSFDFKEYFANRVVMLEDDKTKPLGEYWLKWGMRRTVKGIVFDPEKEHKGYLNLWTGWAFVPRKIENGWSYLDDLIKNTLAAGDEAVYEYILNWCAYMFQHPGRPAEVAIAFKGDKGTGKGTLGRTLTNIAGAHGLAISSASHFTGRFNAHLRDVVMLFADEAVKPKDTTAHSQLKALITEPVLAFEGKGANLVSGKNHLHVMIASNEDEFLPVGEGDGERRYVVQEVLKNRQGDHAFFKKLNDQMKNGGHNAFLWDMQRRDITNWHPRNNLPETDARRYQATSNLSAIGTWWMHVLEEGRFEHATPIGGAHNTDWNAGAIRVFKQHFKKDMEAFMVKTGKTFGMKPGRPLDIHQAKEFKELIPGYNAKLRDKPSEDDYDIVPAESDGRDYSVHLPSLADCRAHMDKRLGGKGNW